MHGRMPRMETPAPSSAARRRLVGILNLSTGQTTLVYMVDPRAESTIIM